MTQKESYNKKRNLDKTQEPESSGKSSIGDKPIFVIQKHDASNLHCDFRLEIDGTLKSWAIPNGPSPQESFVQCCLITESRG